MPKVGDIVLYSAQGITHPAIVLFAHVNEAEHLGENSEPLLHLAFIAPERESEKVRTSSGYLPIVVTEYDVHHASHEFSDEYRNKHGLITEAQIANHRGQGEWVEADVFESLPIETETPTEEAVVSDIEKEAKALTIDDTVAAQLEQEREEPTPRSSENS